MRAVRSLSVQSAPHAAEHVLYSGGFDKTLRILKRVSVFSCTCTLFGVPLLAITSSNPRMSAVQRASLAFVVVVFGVGTTVALHVIVKPYVMRIVARGPALTVETMDAFGRLKAAPLDLAHIHKAQRAWASFESGGRAYFVEETPACYATEEFRRGLWTAIKQAR